MRYLILHSSLLTYKFIVSYLAVQHTVLNHQLAGKLNHIRTKAELSFLRFAVYL